jgi:hypothetical protein
MTTARPRRVEVGEAALAGHTGRAFEAPVLKVADRSRWGAVGGAAIAPPTHQ